MICAGSRPLAIAFLLIFAPLASAAEDPPDEATRRIVTADFNRDGIPDIAEITPAAGNSSGPRLLRVSLGRRDGTFQQQSSAEALGSDPQAIVVGDFNGDGIPDVIVGDGDGSLLELLGDGAGSFLNAGEIARVGSVTSIAVADFNRDGVPDLAISDSRDGAVTVLFGVSSGSSQNSAQAAQAATGAFHEAWSFQLPVRGKVFHLAAADFNHDGLPDLAVTNDDDPSYQVMLNNGNGTFTYAPQLSKLVDPNAHCAT